MDLHSSRCNKCHKKKSRHECKDEIIVVCNCGPGPTGAQGPTGPTGLQGHTGPTGSSGSSGSLLIVRDGPTGPEKIAIPPNAKQLIINAVGGGGAGAEEDIAFQFGGGGGGAAGGAKNHLIVLGNAEVDGFVEITVGAGGSDFDAGTSTIRILNDFSMELYKLELTGGKRGTSVKGGDSGSVIVDDVTLVPSVPGGTFDSNGTNCISDGPFSSGGSGSSINNSPNQFRGGNCTFLGGISSDAPAHLGYLNQNGGGGGASTFSKGGNGAYPVLTFPNFTPAIPGKYGSGGGGGLGEQSTNPEIPNFATEGADGGDGYVSLQFLF